MIYQSKSVTGSKRCGAKSVSGFTLIEMLVVLVLITMLAGLVGPQLINRVGSSKVKIADTQIKLIASGLDTFRLDVGRYPTTDEGLKALSVQPEGVKNWTGPYLAEDVPLDPWDNPYHYERPGKNGAYALYSLGQDASVGGEGESVDQGKF